MTSQQDKGDHFRALHERDSAFIIPNPWDVGTAHLLATLGFDALATTSAGHAFSLGQRDTTIDRDEVMTHCRAIASGCFPRAEPPLPVRQLLRGDVPAATMRETVAEEDVRRASILIDQNFGFV